MHQECVSSDINGPLPRRVIRQTPAICAAQPTPVAEAHVDHGSSADLGAWAARLPKLPQRCLEPGWSCEGPPPPTQAPN